MTISILGPNTFAAHQQLVTLLSEIDSVERFDGEDVELDTVDSLLRSQSLFGATTVVVSNISEQKSLHEDFMKLIESLGETADLIIYEPGIDRRSKYYKFLLKNTDAKEFSELDEYQLNKWITDTIDIDRSAANYLLERLGTDQWLLHSELEKLSLYDQPIDRKLIDSVVEPTPRESIFKLLDSIMLSNEQKAVSQYEDLIAQKLEPHYIINMLAWQLNIVAIVVYGSDKTPDQIAREAKLSPFVVKKTAQATRNVSKSKVRSMVELVAGVDAKLKTQTIDATEAVRQLIIKLSN